MSPRLRALLQRHVDGAPLLRSVLLWGANTDVGKTLVSVGLVRESLARGRPTSYLKPMQTGYPEDSDERTVVRYNPALSDERGRSSTLFTYSPPVSPHLCGDTPADEELLRAILDQLDRFSEGARSGSNVIVETFGGPGSPTPSQSLQVDALRPLFLPALLVGDAALGGISTTLSSYEMIKSRGCVVCWCFFLVHTCLI